jgi:hypothetical protein
MGGEMKYVILIHSNPQSRGIWESMPEQQRAEGLTVYAQLNRELVASGELIATEALADPAHSKQIVIRDDQTMATDGPFAELKEQLAGFYLLECESIERAIEIAGRIPEAELGLVEVRPVMHYEGLEM